MKGAANTMSATVQFQDKGLSSSISEEINPDYLADESKTILGLVDMARTTEGLQLDIHNMASSLVNSVRDQQKGSTGLHAFLHHYDLSSPEGVVLMCLAESLLRIPDSRTIDELIADKLSSGNWKNHLNESDSLFVNASTWALMLTGKLIEPDKNALNKNKRDIKKLFSRMEEPILRAAIKSAISIMAYQFVMGRTINEAIQRSEDNKPFRYSFDMLGEAALTSRDAKHYLNAYADAISVIAKHSDKSESLIMQPSISVKLSALSPRYEVTQQQRACKEISRRLLELACLAKEAGICLTIDAEESDRLVMSLAIFDCVYHDKKLSGWEGLGLAVQAYQKRAVPVLKWLNKLSSGSGKMIQVRLVKGAYWDAEIKHAQELGLDDYPVFTRKCNTDVSYLACARYLINECPAIYPQFATHNAHTLAYIYHHASNRDYEFQRLHGMGEELYKAVAADDKFAIPCRIYAPVGKHEDLLPYLVRRLLENGANTSFVNQIVHDDTGIEEIINDPVTAVDKLKDNVRHPNIPIPKNIFGKKRINSAGINFANDIEVNTLLEDIYNALKNEHSATPIINGKAIVGNTQSVIDPSNAMEIGTVDYTLPDSVKQAIDVASDAWPAWSRTTANKRATLLQTAAYLFETNRAELIALCVREAGKTITDSHNEIREAIDFLRYYAEQCRQYFRKPLQLPGPTGESNQLHLNGRGVFLCISPWNFPVAIYIGQIAAALAAGNTVLAKPAEQTSLVAHLATQLLYEAGIPKEVLGFIPGFGKEIGNIVLTDPRIAGVAFTGSFETAQTINQTLAQRNAALATLIAETGGQNAMIVDSSALPEQIVLDVMQSAFNSAGQRCSALRVLYLQEDIADRVIELLTGHMQELTIGDPIHLSTDIGPVIDNNALLILENHIKRFKQVGKLIYRCKQSEKISKGYFVRPAIIELENIQQLTKEIFGPVLHIIRYNANNLDHVIDEINACGYGLTLGIHSRIENRAEAIRQRVKIGNVYVNRNMVGAVVGVQPFGGCGLSGTGPKAGGPHYLLRFATEQTYTVNTSAIGGNASLMSQCE
jgi:RHH-type transcriptional regulator, proline utilization regulon repressor / proline dehydrogenase / delta 1-pyrroline-5-carboxylate dehydrogenase